MELTFNKTDRGYIADYVATTHFNLHIEGGGRVLLYKRSSGSQGDLLASIPSKCVVDIDVAVNHEATYTIVLGNRAKEVVITTKDGEVINGIIPNGGGSNIPDGYVIFKAQDADFISSDGKYIYVKM